MSKIIIVPTPRDIKQVHSLVTEISGVYTRERPQAFEEPGKAFIRLAFGKTQAGLRKVEVNAFTGTQVNMQIEESKRIPLDNVVFESFWDKVVDEAKAWTETGTEVDFEGDPVVINRDKKLFTLKGGRILFTFDDIRKLAALIGCMLIIFTVSAQTSDATFNKMIKEQEKMRKESAAFDKLMKRVDELVPTANYYSKQTVPTEFNMRIPVPVSPALPKLQSSGMRIISIAPIYTSKFESTIRIEGGGRQR